MGDYLKDIFNNNPVSKSRNTEQRRSIELDRIEKRAIEALAIAPVLRAVSQCIGIDEAQAILQEINQIEAFQRGRSLAEEIGGNGIK